MAETPIRLGILGYGEISRRLSKLSKAIALVPNATLVAIGSRRIHKAAGITSADGFPSWVKMYESYEAVLDDPDVDAVYVLFRPSCSRNGRWRPRKKKHVLLEKPVAPDVVELDRVLAACEASGVQFMDGTLWMHHPRTPEMKEFISDTQRFGQLKSIHCCFTYYANPEFLENDFRLKPDLDGLGALGDCGWYCIRAILWAADHQLPNSVTALPGSLFNNAGVILSCGASLDWADGKVATFHCSVLSNLTMEITATGTKGTLQLHDFVIPFKHDTASYSTASESCLEDPSTGWKARPSEHSVANDLPQEALMIREFVGLVAGIKRDGKEPNNKWPAMTRKTQLVLDAVKASIERGCEAVEVGS
ncbi:hypothetical protein AAG906_022570 [Vitis piasezkii]